MFAKDIIVGGGAEMAIEMLIVRLLGKAYAAGILFPLFNGRAPLINLFKVERFNRSPF